MLFGSAPLVLARRPWRRLASLTVVQPSLAARATPTIGRPSEASSTVCSRRSFCRTCLALDAQNQKHQGQLSQKAASSLTLADDIPTDDLALPLSPTWDVSELLRAPTDRRTDPSTPPRLSPETLRHLHKLSALLPPSSSMKFEKLRGELESMVTLVDAVREVDVRAAAEEVMGEGEREDQLWAAEFGNRQADGGAEVATDAMPPPPVLEVVDARIRPEGRGMALRPSSAGKAAVGKESDMAFSAKEWEGSARHGEELLKAAKCTQGRFFVVPTGRKLRGQE